MRMGARRERGGAVVTDEGSVEGPSFDEAGLSGMSFHFAGK
jgi:hypothetical protein